MNKNSCLGTVDHELELECRSRKEDMAGRLILDIADVSVQERLIPYRNRFLERIGKGDSKSKRFFESMSNYNRMRWEER